MRLVLLLMVLLAAGASADAEPRTAPEIYRAACAACHGLDGSGSAIAQVGFDTPLPDFTNCSFATREADADWFAIAHQGGPIRSFDRRMPAFGDALTEPEILLAISHIRSFCRERGWPRGELNLPRTLVTEKAYPEDEALLTMAVTRGASASATPVVLYERRIGSRSQVEVAVPFTMRQGSGGWSGGLGDVAVAFKRVLADSISRGSIFSAGAEVVLPTGKDTAGFGTGDTVLEPFLAWGQLLPHNAFLQVQSGAELPFGSAGANEAFWRAATGLTMMQRGFGRSWTPIVELVGDRELLRGERSHWDLVPQLQVSLSHRQHILVDAGVRVPLNDRRGRSPTVLAYLLWDWYDGGFLDGWR